MGSCASSRIDSDDRKIHAKEESKSPKKLSKSPKCNGSQENSEISCHRRRNGRTINYLSDRDENGISTTSTEKFNLIIDQILPTVRSLIMKNNEENPADIVKLQLIAKKENLWIPIIFRLINKIEINDPLGPSIISIFLEETPLPTKEQISLLTDKMTVNDRNYSEKIQRNILVILSCLSEKVAGTSVASILTEKTIDFAINCLKYGANLHKKVKLNSKDKDRLHVLLFDLITLEKFSMSAQNKLSIMNKLKNDGGNLLKDLTEWRTNDNLLKHQIGFLAQYLFDNILTPEGHTYGYLKIDTTNINMRLNDEDTSENLKISSDGLEARNDTLSFESVRSTFQVSEGVWFYEATVLTDGIMQIGFATKASSFLNHQGFGIGDDPYSVGYDGCRNLIWYNASHQPVKPKSWKEGDVIGFLLDIDKKNVNFYHNGDLIFPPHTDFFRKVSGGIFPAASFMSFQHVLFNFGRTAFKYPPHHVKFKDFNSHASLSEDQRYVLPKRKKLEILRQVIVKDDACTLCCEYEANVVLIPCRHRNFCSACAQRLSICPICRALIDKFEFQ